MATTALATIDQNKLAAQQAIGKLKLFFESNEELTVLNNQSESLCSQADELKTISTATQYTEAAELVTSIASVTEQITEILDPYTTQRKLFNKAMIEIEHSYLEPGEATRKSLKSAMGAFQVAEERKRREEEARLAAIAKREQEAEAMREAERLQAEGKTEEAEQVVQEAIEAPAPTVIAPSMVPKVSGVTLRTTWRWAFTEDWQKLPEADLRKLVGLLATTANPNGTADEISTSGITALVKSFKEKATSQVPGVKVWSTRG